MCLFLSQLKRSGNTKSSILQGLMYKHAGVAEGALDKCIGSSGLPENNDRRPNEEMETICKNFVNCFYEVWDC